MDANVNNVTAENIITHAFSDERQAAHASPDEVASADSQAALRQFSLERLMGYGVHFADAIELRARVWSGEPWAEVATDLAETCVKPPEYPVSPESPQTRANRLFRASALIRMSQMMMLSDSPERSQIVTHAGKLYEEAAAQAGDRSRVMIESENGTLTGWLHRSAKPHTIGRVLVIGGVEGWGMDCADTGIILAERGIETLAIDGPGHGESRMVHGHFLTTNWVQSYRAAVDFLHKRSPDLPIGVIGQSMGGSFAISLAAQDSRIVACINNGGTSAPALARYAGGAARANKGTTFFSKMAAHVGNVSDDEAEAVWRTVNPIDPAHPLSCPLLIVHGGRDPLISNEDAGNLLRTAQSTDKQMVVFSDGDHCIYNHPDDKHNLIGDWMASRLNAA